MTFLQWKFVSANPVVLQYLSCSYAFQDRALPLAVESGNKNTELRLCNKLVELLVNLKVYEESMEYAKASLILSVNLGKTSFSYIWIIFNLRWNSRNVFFCEFCPIYCQDFIIMLSFIFLPLKK